MKYQIKNQSNQTSMHFLAITLLTGIILVILDIIYYVFCVKETTTKDYTYLNLTDDCKRLLNLEETSEVNPFWKTDLSFEENSDYLHILEFKRFITVSLSDGPSAQSVSSFGSQKYRELNRSSFFESMYRQTPEFDYLIKKIEQINFDQLIRSKKRFGMTVTTNINNNNWEIFAIEIRTSEENGQQIGFSFNKKRFSCPYLELLQSKSREELIQLVE